MTIATEIRATIEAVNAKLAKTRTAAFRLCDADEICKHYQPRNGDFSGYVGCNIGYIRRPRRALAATEVR